MNCSNNDIGNPKNKLASTKIASGVAQILSDEARLK